LAREKQWHQFKHRLMLLFVPNHQGPNMRTTLALDDDLLAAAERFTGLKEKSALVREALKALIERESARRLALLGGSEPALQSVSRRQSQP
jgi:Arc/MetJ family transcription regulator